ncbi:MAG: hypothetical protein AMXMBFR84_37750 [Candidatus Hydrogenedentota bacterium]
MNPKNLMKKYEQAAVEAVAVNEAPVQSDPADSVTETPAPEKTLTVVQSSVDIPILSELPAGYLSGHIDINQMTPRQRGAIRRINAALVAQGATLENGRFVKTNADAVKWILERVA